MTSITGEDKPLLGFVAALSIVALSGCGLPGESARQSVMAPSPPSSGSTARHLVEATDAAFAVTDWLCVASAISDQRPTNCPVQRVTTSGLPAATSAPAAPRSLAGTASSGRVALTWLAPLGGDAPTSYVIEAGSASGLADLANFDTGLVALAFIAEGVPAGTYFVRVRAKNAAVVGPPSNEIVLNVTSGACSGPPGAPGNLTASAAGSVVSLSWTAPAAGCPPTSYVIQAGTGPGLANLANYDTHSVATAYSEAGADAGVYYLRVLAATAAGSGPASNEATVTVLPSRLAATSFVAFGDSVTAGESGLESIGSSLQLSPSRFRPTVLLPFDQRYPTVLQRRLAARYAAQTPSVGNQGVPGEAVTDPGTLSRFAMVVASGQFGVILIMEGTNDLSGPDSTRIPAAIDGLRQMVRYATARGVVPYLATIPPMNPSGFRARNYASESVSQLNDGIRALTISESVKLVDVFQGFNNNLALLGTDGVHPNADGYAKIADVFYAAIKATLEASRASSAGGAGLFGDHRR